MLGYEPNEFEPNVKNWKKLIHPEDWPRVSENLNLHIEGKLPMFEAEYRILNKSGVWQWVQGRGKSIGFDADGKPIRMAGVVADISDRKKSEEALRKINEELQAVIHASPVSIVVYDRDSIVKLWNPASEEIFGWSAAEATGKFLPFIPEDKIEEHIEIRGRALQGERLTGIEARRKRKDGSSIDVRGSTAPLHDSEGRIAGVMAVFMDITERKRSEEALHESMELMQYIVRNDPNAIAVYDRDLHYLAVSNRYLLDYNVKEEDIIGKHHYEVFPEMPQRWKDVHQRCLLGAVESEDDDYFERPDGSVTYNRWECRPWYRSGGEIGGIITYTEVTTERKMAEKALKESEARYRHLFDNSPVGMISVDTEGRILEVNQPLLDIIDSPSAEATKRINMFELPQLVESGISDAFRSCMTTGESALKEFPYVSTWGKQSHLRIVLTPVTNREGTIWGCQATVEDITQQRALEEQLRQAQKMEAVGTLAGGIAHDFNNLLHIISGHAELLDMELAERKLKFGELDAIRQSAHRGADLVKQILTFSRRIDVKFESINLNEEVRSTERLLYRTIPKMIEIDLRLEEGLDRVRADSTQIEQMLINLAVNAKDAMPEGGRLAIETRNVNLNEHYCKSHAEIVPGQYVLLKVSDTGHGMEEDVRQHIFEPFFTTKGLADGTGLGLATVFGIVKMHGGHITCESEVGRGSTFSIYFPAAEAGKPDMEEEQEVSAVAGGREKILVVDDEPLIRDLAKRILEKSGYSVLTAGSGKEGIEVYAQHKSDIALVILDLIMPEMGGKQCLEELLTINPQVKAVIASGFAIKGDTKSFSDSGAKGMVSKPFNMRELLRAVRHVLDGV